MYLSLSCALLRQGLSTLVDRAQFVYYSNIDPETWRDEYAVLSRSLTQAYATSVGMSSPSDRDRHSEQAAQSLRPPPPWEGSMIPSHLQDGSELSTLAEKFQRFGLVQPAPDLPRRAHKQREGDRETARNRFALSTEQVEQAHAAAIEWCRLQ